MLNDDDVCDGVSKSRVSSSAECFVLVQNGTEYCTTYAMSDGMDDGKSIMPTYVP